ncbi:Hypothetical protein ZOBELLIA_2272 [Zobellia galactanivorans]|uniref:Uncharacterized protein n=1 Tax=Zobellia galactanivorans (strain DSM 12802 / CCUG 47099 / CIP 106680 / NCIMB 13871 / Dsij) TaxID=63186 RepID=G0L5R0_ZOBGA|nr:Hypothetical protein ZOBELLIA_2272 [Zobellia galactanivorans]
MFYCSTIGILNFALTGIPLFNAGSILGKRFKHFEICSSKPGSWSSVIPPLSISKSEIVPEASIKKSTKIVSLRASSTTKSDSSKVSEKCFNKVAIKHCFCSCLEAVSSQSAKRGYWSTSSQSIPNISLFTNSWVFFSLEADQLHAVSTNRKHKIVRFRIALNSRRKLRFFREVYAMNSDSQRENT